MSLNKILNRPLFRKEALKKGVLKTINANVGIMVGSPYQPAGTPAVVPGQGVYSPVNTQRMGPPKPTTIQRLSSGPIGRGLSYLAGRKSVPFYLGGEFVYNQLKRADPQNKIPEPVKLGLSGAAGVGATRLPGAAFLGTGPGLIALASAYGLKNRYDAGKELRAKINAMSPKERAEFERMNRIKALEGEAGGYTDQELFGKFVPKPPKTIDEKVAEDKKIVEGINIPSGRSAGDYETRTKELKAENDPLLQDNVTEASPDDNVANLDSVQENSIGAGTPPPPGEDGITNYTDTKTEDRERRKQISLLTKDEKEQQKQNSQSQGTNEILLGGPSTDKDFNKTIALAKKYQEEVFKNEGSQAGLVFLANLSSALLTGTTKKAGLAGAMEVFGQAIGPAVNNYATIKLKEGELRANNREASLNAALDHMKFLNEAAKVERPDVTPGVIQFRGSDGKLRNYNGYMSKGGTAYLPGGLDARGQEQLIPISQSGAIKDSEGNIVGSYENFQKQDKINNRLFEISDILGNRYNALSVARDVLKTLNQEDASGEKVKAGAALAVDQFTRRLSGVAKELVGLEVLDNDISQMTLGALEDQMNKLQEDEFAAIDRSDLSDEAKKEAKEKLNKDNLLEQARKKLKGRGLLSGLNREAQEKLAVQEVTLTYALANTFKDQDRLTQRDVNAAKEIVNIFSLGRSSADVRASITAIANQLESDIRRQEELFRDAGGLESRITNLRGLAQFETFDKGTIEQQLTEDLSLEEINNIIEGIE